MRKKFFSFLLIYLIISPCYGEGDQPFVDLNSISKITRSGDHLVFTTPFGEKILNTKSNQWSYKLKADAKMPGFQQRRHYVNDKYLKLDIPDLFYQQSTYLDLIAADDTQTPKWVLTANAGEGANYDDQDLVDLVKGRAYRLPYENFTTFVIDGHYAWLAGLYGLRRLDLDTEKSLNYITLPAFDSIVANFTFNNQLYYLAKSYGLFSINRQTGEITPVNELNSYIEQGYQFFSGIRVKNNFWLLARRMDSIGNYTVGKEGMSLFRFDLIRRTVSEINTNIYYANHLILHQDSLIGYGIYMVSYEGGEDFTSGGAFSYNLQTEKLTVLSKLPVVSLQLNPPRIVSIRITEGPIFIQNLESSNMETPFNVTSSEWITARDKDREGFDFDGRTRVVYKSDPGRYSELTELYKRSIESITGDQKKTDLEKFRSLKIQFRTITVPAREAPNSRK